MFAHDLKGLKDAFCGSMHGMPGGWAIHFLRLMGKLPDAVPEAISRNHEPLLSSLPCLIRTPSFLTWFHLLADNSSHAQLLSALDAMRNAWAALQTRVSAQSHLLFGRNWGQTIILALNYTVLRKGNASRVTVALLPSSMCLSQLLLCWFYFASTKYKDLSTGLWGSLKGILNVRVLTFL